MTTYSFTKTINSDQFVHELTVFLAQMNTDYELEITAVNVETVGDQLNIELSDALPDQTTVDALGQLVSDHAPNPNYLPPEQQSAVDQLIAYLNSATPSVANTARAQMVLAMAPRLPPDLIATVNANIHAIVGF